MRKRSATLLLLIVSVCLASPVSAQSGPAVSVSTVRYHFGDNPAWSSPSFDDTSWSSAQQGRWPEPAYRSDGWVWVRLRVSVRRDTAPPLGIRVVNPSNTLVADEVFVNGTSVGTIGNLPPHEWVNCLPQTMAFDLPPGVVQPGTVATIALRLWYPPFVRRPNVLNTATFGFDQRRTLHAEEDTARVRALLHNLPGLALNSLILLLGCAVLLLGRASRSRTLLLYGAMLATAPWITLFFELVEARIVSPSAQEYFPLQVVSQLPAMIMSVVFIWSINNLHDVWLKRLAFAAMWIFNIGMIVAFVPGRPSTISTVAMPVSMAALKVFNVITLGVLLWVLFVLRRNRLIAFAMALPPLGSLTVGFRVLYQQGQAAFDAAFFLAGLFLSIALARNAWKEWRTRDALRAEFEAAREVQQRLVTPAVDLPGFRIQSVYSPATQVGGDFFRVIPESDGSVLIVVGDVSGKGLRAALTVSALIGALRTLPPLPPARILAALNRALVGHMQDGFVTCLAVRIHTNGTIIVSNAGHLAPYRNGEEYKCDSGLPLGVTADAAYAEFSFTLAPGDTLTFVSDGVVEARNARGELFGFDRTREISRQSAEAIALAAQQYGQQDDITVLTVAFAPAEVAHA